jgi:dethiobiotin synthetase
MKLFITGIGTDIGKTIVSAVLTEALQADYWKPVQCGNLKNSDTKLVQKLVSNKKSKFHHETYRFKLAASPHAAADKENITIDLNKIKLPDTKNHLIIEGAGGLLVPLNEKDLVIDLIKKLQTPVVVVSMNYLGSINHTLLTLSALRENNIEIAGIIFNGKPTPTSEDYILNYFDVKLLGRLLPENKITKDVISKYAKQFKNIGL